MLRINETPLSIDKEYKFANFTTKGDFYNITIRDTFTFKVESDFKECPFDQIAAMIKIELTSKEIS